jgi:hypothetical protein
MDAADPHRLRRALPARPGRRWPAGAVALLCLAGTPAPPVAAPRPETTPPAARPRVPALAVDAASVVEGDAGTVIARFVVRLSAPAATPVTVRYATRDDTASAIAASPDYEPASGAVRIAPGARSANVDVEVHGDTALEDDEAFLLVLSRPNGATLAAAEARAVILDDDAELEEPELPELSITDARVTEGDSGRREARFTATLSAPSPTLVAVDYATADGSASAGEDYVEAAGQLRFAPGSTSQSARVLVLGDAVEEGDEDFVVQLSSPVEAVLAGDLGRGLILDDDGPGAIAMSALGSSERFGRPGQMVVLQVSLRSAAGGPVTRTPVSWRLDGDGVLLDGPTTLTDGEGIATQRVRLSASVGRSAVRAEDASRDQSVLFQLAVSAPPE